MPSNPNVKYLNRNERQDLQLLATDRIDDIGERPLKILLEVLASLEDHAEGEVVNQAIQYESDPKAPDYLLGRIAGRLSTLREIRMLVLDAVEKKQPVVEEPEDDAV